MIRWLEKNKEIAFILTLLTAIEIFFFSSIPGTAITGGISWLPTAYHFIVFFLFAFFLFITIKGNKKIKASHIILVLCLSMLYAVLDEFHQMFVPFRDASIRDIITDSLGIFTAVRIYSIVSKKSLPKSEL